MKEVSIDIGDNRPRILTMDMVEKADKMITMGCGAEAEAVCPASFIKTEEWALEDPHGRTLEEIRKIRDEVKERVTRLIKDITQEQEV